MARCSTHQKNSSAQYGNAPTDDTPLRTNPSKPEVPGVKLLIVPKNMPISKDGDQVLKVEMEQLVVYPARGKLPTVRHGKPFRHASAPGAKHNVPVKIDDNDDDNVNKNDGKKENDEEKPDGDASIETDDTPYDTSIVAHGLLSLQSTSSQTIHKKMGAKDDNSKNVKGDGGFQKQNDEDSNHNSDDSDLPAQPVKADTLLPTSGNDDKCDMSGKMDKMQHEVEVMISQGKGGSSVKKT